MFDVVICPRCGYKNSNSNGGAHGDWFCCERCEWECDGPWPTIAELLRDGEPDYARDWAGGIIAVAERQEKLKRVAEAAQQFMETYQPGPWRDDDAERALEAALEALEDEHE
jgi:hypothetical protein